MKAVGHSWAFYLPRAPERTRYPSGHGIQAESQAEQSGADPDAAFSTISSENHTCFRRQSAVRVGHLRLLVYRHSLQRFGSAPLTSMHVQ